jgi:hypothetical protein
LQQGERFCIHKQTLQRAAVKLKVKNSLQINLINQRRGKNSVVRESVDGESVALMEDSRRRVERP